MNFGRHSRYYPDLMALPYPLALLLGAERREKTLDQADRVGLQNPGFGLRADLLRST